MSELWFDCSASYSVIPSPQQVADLHALGFVGVIVGSSYKNNTAQAQLAAYEAGGMRTEEYQFPSALRPTTRPWYVDAELADATLEALRDALRIGSQGPYSRKGWADENLPDWDCKAEFPNAELFDARYVHGDGPCRIQYAIDTGGDVFAAIESERSWILSFKPYWGFTKAKITQWHNSITICGVNMDLNEYEEVPSTEVNDMVPFLAWDLDRARVYLIGPFGAVWTPIQADADALAAKYGKVEMALHAATIDAFNG